MLTAAMSANFREVRTLKEENERLRKALEERKLIDRAKGILMRKEGLLEDDAYRRIQKLSMDRRKKMAEIAEAIILAEEVAK
ncbi:MAG: ANTAR domain-containing protein [Deltaproteobacteria bacterium]